MRDPAVADQGCGRLKERYCRVSGALDVRIEPITRPTGKAHLSVSWTGAPRWCDWAALSEGCYLLRTNRTDTDPAPLWKRYTQLTEAKWALRIHKSDQEIRPIWCQKQERALAHILKIKSGDMVLLTRTADGKEHPIGLRCVTPPNEGQTRLLHRLRLNLPQRLRRIDEGSNVVTSFEQKPPWRYRQGHCGLERVQLGPARPC
ncbi:MAG: hypothetical protein ACUVXJ_10075 [Phycisphaerae bacterium]